MKIKPLSAPDVVLAGAALFYFCANLQKVLVPGAAFNELQAIFQLDAASVTRFGAAFFYTYALLQLVAGPLADRFSGARVIAVAGSLLVLGGFGSALIVSPAWLVASRILTAAGAAMVYLSLIQHAGSFLREKLPLVLGVIFIVGYSGAVTGTTPFIVGIRRFGYSRMMLAAALFSLVLYLGYLAVFWRSKLPRPAQKTNFSFKQYGLAFSMRNFPVFFLTSIPFAINYALMTIIGKKFFEDYVGFSPVGAGNVLFAMNVIAAVNGFITAGISRGLHNRKLPILWYSAAGALLIQLTFMLLIGVHCRTPYFFVILSCLMASTANIAPVYVAYLREINDERLFATVVGISNTASYLFTAVLGTLCGKVLDVFPPEILGGIKIYGRNAYLLMFAVFAAFAVVSVIFVTILTVRERRERRFTHPQPSERA